METETWIERVIIQQLSYPDKRYKHGYREDDQSTVAFIVDCAYLANLTPDGHPAQTWEQVHKHEEAVEDDVKEAVATLHENGLITKVREQPIEPLDPEVTETTPVWEPTEEGLAEAAAINDAYERDLATLTAEYDNLESVPHDELIPLLKQYGVVPDTLPQPEP